MFSAFDHSMMQRALDEARKGTFTTTPNPRVGCVIVKDGQVIGTGFTQPAGQAHAEARAIADCRSQGNDPAGSTVYVTLEPCSHFGRTAPCVNALIDARVARVVAAIEDPNPMVSGQGLEALRGAGMEVRCGLARDEAYELNIGFFSRMNRKRPWVRLKVAISLDGFTALQNGDSHWITSELARQDGHVWRARACAILTGIGTVKEDDPQLTVRDVDTARQPLRVIIDSRLEISLEAKVILNGALIFCAVNNPAKAAELKDRGVEVVVLPNPEGKVDLAGVLEQLAARGINELHVEAGGKLNGSFLQTKCVDELLVYTAPIVLGAGRTMFELPAPDVLSHAERWELLDRLTIGPDVRARYRRAQVRVEKPEPVPVPTMPPLSIN